MTSYIKGKFKKIIYQNLESNYLVALFKVSETDNDVINSLENKLINVTGLINDLKLEIDYLLKGEFVMHPKYSWQFAFSSYEVVKPEGKDAILAFLQSSFVAGCGKTTAKKIVDKYGDKALDKIKEDVNNLLVIDKMTALKAMKIYNSIMEFEKNDQIIMDLTKMGFSIEDSAKILAKHILDINLIKEGNLYILKDIFDFKKIDDIYVNNFDRESDLRCKECILNSMLQISFNEGSTYYTYDEIYKALTVLFNLNISSEKFMGYLEKLTEEGEIVVLNKRFYLTKYFMEEKIISQDLHSISKNKVKKIKDFNKKINDFEKKQKIIYNDEQKRAINSALTNNISIISGGPGTGKTTIIKAIVDLYIKENHLMKDEVLKHIALLAPTGRASKKLSLATGLPAYTIHRFLKWHKETDTFEYDENNKIIQKLVIVDETSMIDISLMKALIVALNKNCSLVFVGDIYQLPSVGPGLVLRDMINSDLFSYIPLNIIYRQSDNSYIPFLAKDIKMQNIDEEFMFKRDDYNFIPCADEEILSKVISSVKYALSKDINEDKMQILAPIYKGVNGIDNLNIKLQEIYNPPSFDKNEIKYGDKIFRENDKVLQLVNDSEKSVFNGDIGKIIMINKHINGKEIIQIDFDGNIVYYEKKELKNITHAYAMTIHKSQGSEFEHVIMPISKSYYNMLYNKLLYTGVSRAKTTLTLIGDPRYFTTGIQNNYSSLRKTSLNDFLLDDFAE